MGWGGNNGLMVIVFLGGIIKVFCNKIEMVIPQYNIPNGSGHFTFKGLILHYMHFISIIKKLKKELGDRKMVRKKWKTLGRKQKMSALVSPDDTRCRDLAAC